MTGHCASSTNYAVTAHGTDKRVLAITSKLRVREKSGKCWPVGNATGVIALENKVWSSSVQQTVNCNRRRATTKTPSMITQKRASRAPFIRATVHVDLLAKILASKHASGKAALVVNALKRTLSRTRSIPLKYGQITSSKYNCDSTSVPLKPRSYTGEHKPP